MEENTAKEKEEAELTENQQEEKEEKIKRKLNQNNLGLEFRLVGK